MPGWISKHEARYDPTGMITITGGQLVQEHDAKQRFHRNFEEYALDMKSYAWQRLTNRNWHEFSIRQENGTFMLEHRPEPEALLPRDIEYATAPCQGNEDSRFLVAEVPISLTIRTMHIELIVEGALPEPVLERLVEEIRANTEADVKRRCILERL